MMPHDQDGSSVDVLGLTAIDSAASGPGALKRITTQPFEAHADRSDPLRFGGIATTEICNLSCVMCHFNGPNAVKKGQTLSPELVEKTLGQLRAGEEVWFAATGDFFIDPHAVDHLRKARDRGLRPCVLTHGQLFTPELMDQVLDAGVRMIRMSVDSTDPVQYRKIRRGGELQRILDACGYLRAKKREYPDLRVEINCTLFKNTFSKQQDMIDFWRGKVDQVNFNAEYYNSFNYRNIFFVPEQRVDCKIQLYVVPSGRITPCCAMMVYAHDNDVSWLPHIAEDSLEQAHAKLVDLYRDSSSPLAKICRSCDWWIMWATRENGETPYLRCVPLDERGGAAVDSATPPDASTRSGRWRMALRRAARLVLRTRLTGVGTTRRHSAAGV